MARSTDRVAVALMTFALLLPQFSVAGAGAAEDATQGLGPRTIVGTWRTAVGPRDCQTDASGPFGIRGLFTFHEGGTMAEYGIGPGSSPALRSPGFGVWQRERGFSEYSFSFGYYRYDANGIYVGAQRVRAVMQLAPNGDEFTAKSVVEIFDANDNLIASVCAASMGRRFQ